MISLTEKTCNFDTFGTPYCHAYFSFHFLNVYIYLYIYVGLAVVQIGVLCIVLML